MIAIESVPRNLTILTTLTEGYAGNFVVRQFDGSTWEPHPGQPVEFTVICRHPGSLRSMFWPFSKVSLGEAYIFGDCDIEGDMFAATRWATHLGEQVDRRGVWGKLGLLFKALSLPRGALAHDPARIGPTGIEGKRTKECDRAAVSFTYDFPCGLFQLFLDPNMQYSCAYFTHANEDLDAAQERKLDYVCRKLRLRPGERLLDIGCGWGGLVVHAAKHYGVQAVGVTLSHVQAQAAERAVAAAGLRECVQIIEGDYRDIADSRTFDKAASIGMAEHVGERSFPTLFGKLFELLKPGGAYLHHAITLRPGADYPRFMDFAWKYVFPNGELPSITATLTAAAGAGFEIRDVESLREHYALTLEHWVRRLEANHERALEWTDEVGYRIFRMYMAGAIVGFATGVFNLNQTLLIKADAGRSGLPWTRADWYAN